MFNLNNKVVLVTGAASGIGAEVARGALTKGAKHVAILDINVELGEALQKELNSKHGDKRAKFIKCDVSKDLDASFEEILITFGYIDVVVNNAGILNDAPHMVEKQVGINVTALIKSSLKAYNMMHVKQGGKGGTIINMSSTAALVQFHTTPIYCATKSAVLQFSNCLGMNPNYDRSGVRIVTVCFGATDTNLLKGKIGTLDKEMYEDIAKTIDKITTQTAESAARGVLEAYEKGASASTWLITDGKAAEDITGNVQKAFEILSQGVY